MTKTSPNRIFYSPMVGAQLTDGSIFAFPTSSILVMVESVDYFFLAIPFFDPSGLIGSIPTPKMIADIVDIIGEESIRKFWEWHNKAVIDQFLFVAEGDLRGIDVYPSGIELCRKMKVCVQTYCYYKAIILYCQAIFWKGNSSVEYQMDVQDRYRQAINKAMRGKVKPSELFEPNTQKNWLNKITDFVDAQSRLSNYDSRLRVAQHNNSQIQDLINRREQEHREWLELCLKSKKGRSRKLKPPAICPICGEFIEQVTRFPSSCGSEKCKKEYEAVKRAKGRETISRKPFKHLITKTGKGIRCQICGNQKSNLYTDKFFCFKCLQGDLII
jgi:hypothetical protein